MQLMPNKGQGYEFELKHSFSSREQINKFKINNEITQLLQIFTLALGLFWFCCLFEERGAYAAYAHGLVRNKDKN